MTRISLWASGVLLAALLLGAVWLHGSSAGRSGCETAAAKAAANDALQASRALDRVYAEVDRLREQAGRTRRKAKRAAAQVRPDDQCSSAPEPFRGLFPHPDSEPPATATGVVRSAVPAVATP